MSIPIPLVQLSNMNNDTFQHFYRSIAPGTLSDTALDDWLTQDLARAGLLSPTGSSGHSSPDLASPLNVFFTSPVSVAIKDEPVEPPPVVSTPPFFGGLAPSTPAPSIPPSLIALSQPPLIQPAGPPLSLTPPEVLADKTTKKRVSTSSSSGEPSTTEEILIKRQKNTDAARRSRLKKAQKMDSLEKRVAELQKANTALLFRAAVLETDKSSLQQKEADQYARIEELEAQLADAHKSIANLPSQT